MNFWWNRAKTLEAELLRVKKAQVGNDLIEIFLKDSDERFNEKVVLPDFLN